MAGVPPNSLRQDELPEYPYVGPFGGINSEVPLDKIGRSGFQEVQNIIFRKSQARSIPAFTPLASPSGEPIIGIGDFFNVNGTRIAVLWTPTKMYKYVSGVYTQITGALTGNTAQFMQWDVVGYKLYFSQDKDVVQVWDGITAGFAPASGSAVPGKYLCEFDTHLLVANTIEAGPTNAPNRLRWTGAGDGTDWTSFSSGQQDAFNGLGPINGLSRIYQSAYLFQQWGITQIVRTGIGLAPFQLIPMGSRAKGSILPYGVATFGEIVSCYVGKNNIYMFDGTESVPIGSHPIDGNRYLGARGRIFSDLFIALQTNIFGIILTSANGNDYESYWIIMPGLNKAWVYHFDEGSWTQVFFNPSQLLGPVGVLPLQSVPRIMDLIGTIQSQTWSPSSLTNSNQLDTMVISDANANSVSYLNFGAPSSVPTSGSINSNDGWYIKSGQLEFDDPRHGHTVKKVRLSLIDYAAVTINMRWTNEFGQTQTKTLSYGSGSGATLKRVMEFSLPGKYLTWELSGPQGINWGMSEITPIYDTSGEVQGGTR
jgi:hypothetical protein